MPRQRLVEERIEILILLERILKSFRGRLDSRLYSSTRTATEKRTENSASASLSREAERRVTTDITLWC